MGEKEIQMKEYTIQLEKVQEPRRDCSGRPVCLTDETIQERKRKVLNRMKQRGLDQLVVYGDVEHSGNFEYLVGYFTRFEESLLVINADGKMTLALGNENLNKAPNARIEANAVHIPLFSLPNQPNRKDKSLKELLADAGIKANSRIGLTGWKMFTSELENNKKIFDIPSYIVDAIRSIVGREELLSNETDLFIGENGARTTNNANEIAHYEYGAALASDCVLDAMDKLEPGVPELELGDALVRGGQHTSVVTVAASGPRFVKANLFPTDNTVKVGDKISLTVGYRGGSSSRAGYAVHSADELPEGTKDYVKEVAAPYFAAYTRWLEEIRIGMTGGDMFDKVEEILPRAKYHWSLCPGHLTAEEEWMSSPIYEGSVEKLRSGMMFQIDIIPSVPGYGGASAESTVVLADGKLKDEIQKQYPEMWSRMQARRAYLADVLGIVLSEDVLPMCGTVAYLRPYLLNKECAFVSR
jgi:Xaa-Pro aminopeptidase